MGELVYIVNHTKKQYINKTNKWREWTLNPKSLLPLFYALNYQWSGDQIAVVGEYVMYNQCKKYKDVTKELDVLVRDDES